MERISVIIDTKADQAVTGIKSFRSAVAEADGIGGKFKAGWKQTTAAVTANAGLLAAGAGAALISFGVKAVGAFQRTALAAGQFGDAAGIAVDDASRWIEVANDLGISTETVLGAFQKMNKSIADGKQTWSEYGVEIIRAADGTVNASATFQNAITTIGAIVDPTLRAKAAQEVFGKSYGQAAELMEMSASDLKAALDGVGDAQVITPGELAKAKKFRDTMDDVSDALAGVQIAAGAAFVGVANWISDATGAVEELGREILRSFDGDADKNWRIIEAFDEAEQAAADFNVALLDGANSMDEVRAIVLGLGNDEHAANLVALEWHKSHLQLNASLDGTFKELVRVSTGTRRAKEAMQGVATATAAADREFDELLGTIDDDEAWLNLLDTMENYKTTMADAEASDNDKVRSSLAVKRALIEQLQAIEGLPAEQRTDILTLIDQGAYDQAGWLIGELVHARDLIINPKLGKGANGSFVIIPGSKFASGTDSAPAGMALVGEEGPELVMMSGGERVFTADETARMASGVGLGAASTGGMASSVGAGSGVVVNATFNGVTNAREIVDLITAAVKDGQRAGWMAPQ